MQTALFHLDLGIGGAERLVLDCAKALSDIVNEDPSIPHEKRQHQVTIFTTRFSDDHCFDDCRRKDLNIVVYGAWIPRTVFGIGTLALAAIRLLYLSVVIFFLQCFGLMPKFELLVSDNLALLNPILKLLCRKLLFYSHFPEPLMTENKNTRSRKVYRGFFEWLEERGFHCCDFIATNSAFSRDKFLECFPSVNPKKVAVLYPPVDIPSFKLVQKLTSADVDLPENLKLKFGESLPKYFFVSLNRYENKKRHNIALEAFSQIMSDPAIRELQPVLIIAGGFDNTLPQNIDCYTDLQVLVHSLSNIDQDNVKFLKSIDEKSKQYLLANAVALLYTPVGEHFGIVPVECMSFGTQVIATSSGGPRETVVEGVTGHLCGVGASDFATAMKECLESKISMSGEQDELLRAKCRERAQLFCYSLFVDRVQSLIRGK